MIIYFRKNIKWPSLKLPQLCPKWALKSSSLRITTQRQSLYFFNEVLHKLQDSKGAVVFLWNHRFSRPSLHKQWPLHMVQTSGAARHLSMWKARSGTESGPPQRLSFLPTSPTQSLTLFKSKPTSCHLLQTHVGSKNIYCNSISWWSFKKNQPRSYC